jgi:myo-inositol-1(or 4)-monophosphatase
VIDPLFLATAVEAVLRAGRIQMAHFRTDLKIDKKGVIDLVTEVDVAVERMFRDLVAERFPGHVVLAEELGGGELPAGRPCWIFDPLDGTTNYAHGLPIFASSLALEIDGEVVVGAVYDPTRRELFTAMRGGGAYLNGEPMAVSANASLIDALLVTGFPYSVHEEREDLVSLFSAFLAEAQAVRRLGSAALDLCYVAAGRMDAFWEQHLKPWDMAAGALMLSEAGGMISALDGGPFDLRNGQLMASNGVLHQGLLDVVRRWRADRYAKPDAR